MSDRIKLTAYVAVYGDFLKFRLIYNIYRHPLIKYYLIKHCKAISLALTACPPTRNRRNLTVGGGEGGGADVGVQ